jgi:hypothetical protein
MEGGVSMIHGPVADARRGYLEIAVANEAEINLSNANSWGIGSLGRKKNECGL